MASVKYSIKGQKMTLDNLSKVLVFSSYTTLLERLKDINYVFSKHAHKALVLKVIKTSAEKEKKRLEAEEDALGHSLELVSDRRLSRLKVLAQLPESIVMEEFFKLQEAKLIKAYLEALWLQILKSLVKSGVEENYLVLMCEESLEKTFDDLPHLQGFYDQLTQVLSDEQGDIEGLKEQEFISVCMKDLTVPEIMTIGKKYGVTIKKTLKKEELKEKIVKALRSKNLYDETVKARIETATLKEIDELNHFYNLEVSPYLTKEQMARMIIDQKETKSVAVMPVVSEGDETQEPYATREEYIALLKEVEALKKALRGEDVSVGKDMVKPRKRYTMTSFMFDATALVVIAFMFFGTMTYFLDNLVVVQSLNQTFNQVTFRGEGIMSLYHRMLEFVINGVA